MHSHFSVFGKIVSIVLVAFLVSIDTAADAATINSKFARSYLGDGTSKITRDVGVPEKSQDVIK